MIYADAGGVPMGLPRTAKKLHADPRFGDELWRDGHGKSFYQLMVADLGAEATGQMFVDATEWDGIDSDEVVAP